MKTPTDAHPLRITCIECDGRRSIDGKDCAACLGFGFFEVHTCPHACLDRETARAVEAADQEDKGNWPVDGGWLDQTRHTLQVVGFVRNESALAELRERQKPRK